MKHLLMIAIAMLVAGGAVAQDAPKRKSGLWEVRMSSPQMPTPIVSRQCVDQKSDDMSRQQSRDGQEKCSKKSMRREGGSVVFESVCQIEGSTATSRGVFSGDFESSYKGELTTRFAPPLHGNAESKMSFQARHTGPCAPGQKPGDIAVQGGPGGANMQKMMEDARSGKMDPEQARRMAEEMQRQSGKK